MLVTGLTIGRRERVCSLIHHKTLTKASGAIQKHKVRDSFDMQTEGGTLETGSMICSMDMEGRFGQMSLLTTAILRKAGRRDKELTDLATVQFTAVVGRTT
jgi:hypothetical protein